MWPNEEINIVICFWPQEMCQGQKFITSWQKCIEKMLWIHREWQSGTHKFITKKNEYRWYVTGSRTAYCMSLLKNANLTTEGVNLVFRIVDNIVCEVGFHKICAHWVIRALQDIFNDFFLVVPSLLTLLQVIETWSHYCTQYNTRACLGNNLQLN
jgi:hypothetical protein